jgi:murein DD-endopeptidase MepM/ murein hydrolase activator NlpD
VDGTAELRITQARAALGPIAITRPVPAPSASVTEGSVVRAPEATPDPFSTLLIWPASQTTDATGPQPLAAATALTELRRSESALSDLERSQHRYERNARRLGRVARMRVRKVAAIRQRMASTRLALAGTEASLGYQITVMTKLAQARATKKGRKRPVRPSFGWPARGRITQPYGCTGFRLEPRRGSCAHFHDGIDIAGASGTPIRAAATGVVAYVGWNPWDHAGRAYIVVIGHAGGFVTRYGHLLPRQVVTVGRLVRKGQLIGYMGSTGNSTGPHLHFELLRGNTTTNPSGYL